MAPLSLAKTSSNPLLNFVSVRVCEHLDHFIRLAFRPFSPFLRKIANKQWTRSTQPLRLETGSICNQMQRHVESSLITLTNNVTPCKVTFHYRDVS
jgi:hypothetical protein